MKNIELSEIKRVMGYIAQLTEHEFDNYIKNNKYYQNALKVIERGLILEEIQGKNATVKEDSKWIYAGHTFKILDIHSISNTGIRYELDLKGTEFEKEGHTYTIIHEDD